MKRIIAVIAIAILSACATTQTPQTASSTQSVQVTYTQACTAYSGAFSAALDARKAGKLTPSMIASIGAIDAQITPLCTGSLPANIQSAVTAITSATAAIASEQLLQGVTH